MQPRSVYSPLLLFRDGCLEQNPRINLLNGPSVLLIGSHFSPLSTASARYGK